MIITTFISQISWYCASYSAWVKKKKHVTGDVEVLHTFSIQGVFFMPLQV